MQNERMTIHRALSELKLIDSRIEKGLIEVHPSGVMQKDKLVNGLYTKEDFDKGVQSKLQSVTDLIDRKIKIKSAIVKANGITEVKIGNETMTIADAINFKAIIVFKKHLISNLEMKHNKTKATLSKNNDTVELNALRLAEAALQKDNIKIGDGDAVAITEPYLDKNRYILVDPLGIEKVIIEMQEQIDSFDAEVDAVLSEINAITIIEI